MNNSTINETLDFMNAEPIDFLMSRYWLKGFFIFIYVIVFIVGVTGNSMVLYIVLQNKHMQTITNIFIANLAVSDIAMCLLSVPFTPISAFMNKWPFGTTLCHIVPLTLGVSVYVSTLTSTVIAVDRYFVIVYPFKPRMKISVCVLLIIAIWILSVSISIPLAVFMEAGYNEEIQMFECSENWPKKTARQFYTVTNLILQYIIPCIIISYCYIMVSFALLLRSRARIANRLGNLARDQMEIARKRRTNRMLIAMISIFVICWLPLNIVLIISEYNTQFLNSSYFMLVFFISHTIAVSSTIYNPFLYGGMNDNFQKEFMKMLPFLFSKTDQCKKNMTMYTTVNTAHKEAVLDVEMKPLSEKENNQPTNEQEENI